AHRHGRPAGWPATLLALAALVPAAAMADDGEAFEREIRPLLAARCGDCHSGDAAQGGFRVEEMDAASARTTGRTTWQKVKRQVAAGVMPPADAPPLDADARTRFLAWIDQGALTPDCSQGERPGRVTLRRLNRTAYDNTVRDLLGVEIDAAAAFPTDDVGYGFDHIGDVLSVPPVLFERALDAAERVARAAISTGEAPDAPVRSAGGGTLITEGEIGQEFELPAEGDYLLRFVAAGDQAGPDPVRMGVRVDGREEHVVDVPNRKRSPKPYEFPVRLAAGKHRVAAAFLNDFYDPLAANPRARDRNLHVTAIEVVGPMGVVDAALPPGHRRVFATPVPAGLDAEAERRLVIDNLRPLVSRAFRRPATDAELERLAGIHAAARADGEGIEAAMRVAVTAMLVSPSFLFLVEADPPAGEIRSLGDHELAARLSYFLWSSMPDDELAAAADRGEVHTEEQLVAQARRMLRDGKSRSLANVFAPQWLHLRQLATFSPDRGRFPAFDEPLRAAMRRETEEFFDAIVREDRSILEMLDADWTMVDERLAKHYGIEGVSGGEFRRVAVDRSRRGGLLGQASILAVTSNPTRTSPVKRGRWVLENLLAAPPPPAPPNVPELAAGRGPLQGTLRQQMEQHRADPSCASCHRLMDPLGFGLENFDAIGAWRDAEGETPVDASGELPDGRRFTGPAELRRVLLERAREFRRCLAEKLLVYALGRGLEYYDACAVERIAGVTEAGGDRFSVMVEEIVKSPAFRQRESAPGN
ncbi:MAG: DUF1592 domain-containing protein, partial [Planctomycetaceae bacterium]